MAWSRRRMRLEAKRRSIAQERQYKAYIRAMPVLVSVHASRARLFYRFVGRHHLGRITSALSLRLLEPGERFGVDETELLRGDTES